MSHDPPAYRGRLAPSPTGLLHAGHARTFGTAWARARTAGGSILLRNDDLDRARVRPEFVAAMLEDLRWLGLDWDEGPFHQSERLDLYRAAFEQLRESGRIYPCVCSRQDVLRALQAPHPGEEEPVYPGTCRARPAHLRDDDPRRVNWRLRIPPDQCVAFEDGACGRREYRAGSDFGDFVVWRHDGFPAYQLACVVDDHAMGITEVVRGADLLVSTARQLLLYEALGWHPPAFYHCPLVTDEKGVRLAKRHDALSLRELRRQGRAPSEFLGGFRV